MPAPKRLTQKNKTRSRPKSPPVATDDALTQRVRAVLADVPGLTEKRMFGSTGFLVRSKLCITARATRLMLRIDPADHDAALKRAGCTTVIMKGREYRGYVFVAADSVKTARALTHWLKQALDFNQCTFGKIPARTAYKQVIEARLNPTAPANQSRFATTNSCAAFVVHGPTNAQPSLDRASSRFHFSAMSILQLKQEISRLNQRERREIQLYLLRLKRETPAWKKAAAQKIRDIKAGKFVTLEELKARIAAKK